MDSDSDKAYTERLQAQLRAADARINELESAARASDAKAEMDEISGLRAHRDRVQRQLGDLRRDLRADWQAVRKRLDTEMTEFRRAIADVRSRYSAWDAGREKRFSAHLDRIDGALRRSTAKDADAASAAGARIRQARDNLKAKVDEARRNYDAWCERRTDERLMRTLDDSERALEDAFDDYAAALDNVVRRATGPRND